MSLTEAYVTLCVIVAPLAMIFGVGAYIADKLEDKFYGNS